MPASLMRDYLRDLRRSGGLLEPGLVAAAVLALTSLAFFRVALLPEFGAELDMSTFQLGLVTTVFAVGRLLADLPGGHLADKLPARGLLAASAGGIAAGSLVLGLSVSVITLYAAVLLLGVTSSATNATGMTFFSNVAGTGYRGTSMAIFSAGLLGGQALGPAVAGVVAAAAGWRASFLGGAAVAAGVSLALASTVRRRIGARSDPGSEPPAEYGVVAPGWGPMLVLQSVSFAVFLTLGSVPQTLVPIVGSQSLGLGTATIGLALGMGGLARFAGTLIGGRLSDKVSRKAALVPGLLVQAVGVGLLAFPPSVGLWLAAIAIMSLASFAVPIAAAIVGDLSDPARVGAQLGRFRFAGDIGLIAGPVSVSALYQAAGGVPAFGMVAAILAGVALVCLRLLPESRPPA